MVVEKTDLTISKSAFFRIYEEYRAKGKSQREAFYSTTSRCELEGYQNRYSSFETFKRVLMRLKLKVN